MEVPSPLELLVRLRLTVLPTLVLFKVIVTPAIASVMTFDGFVTATPEIVKFAFCAAVVS